MPRVPISELLRFATELFQAVGAESTEARIVAEHLVESNLAGHDSHGIMRIPQYLDEIHTGRIVPASHSVVDDEWPTGCVIDARGAFGQVACHEAMTRALDKAREAGIGAVSIRNSNHSGRMGTYVEIAAAEEMIGLVTANAGGAGQWVAPFGGRERRLSTNPLAIGAPSGTDFPIILDISTSIVPEGKVRYSLQRGQETPDGWLVDAEGHPTRDPQQLYETPSAAILPLGGTAGHKGFGLAFMVDILSGALSGAGCPSQKNIDSTEGSGLFMLAIDIKRFGPLIDFSLHVAEMVEYVQSSLPAEGFERVMVPGEFEHRQRETRQREGIDIPEATIKELQESAADWKQQPLSVEETS